MSSSGDDLVDGPTQRSQPAPPQAAHFEAVNETSRLSSFPDESKETLDTDMSTQRTIPSFEEESKNGPSETSAQDNLNKLFIDLGGVGKFQILAYLVIALGINSTGYWGYPLGFYTQEPTYTCEFISGVSEA